MKYFIFIHQKHVIIPLQVLTFHLIKGGRRFDPNMLVLVELVNSIYLVLAQDRFLHLEPIQKFKKIRLLTSKNPSIDYACHKGSMYDSASKVPLLNLLLASYQPLFPLVLPSEK
jgi:hypothetical protein